MSTPTTPMATRDVAGFVAAVRAALDDLSADEVDALTEDLEVDLTDELAEAGLTPSDRYGDAAEYARELRAAAGLPPRRERPRRFGGRLAGSLRHRWARARGAVEGQAWWPAVRDFLILVRPAWWVLRAVILVLPVALVVGLAPALVVGLAAIVLSVEAGRRIDSPSGWWRRLGRLANLAAVLGLLILLIGGGQGGGSSEAYGVYSPMSGLTLNGDPVTNVFPYDAQGRPLTGVQLYDQNGRSLEIGEDQRTTWDHNGNEVQLVPASAAGTPPRWNVYPMRRRVTTQQVDSSGVVTETPGEVSDAPAPFAAVPPLK